MYNPTNPPTNKVAYEEKILTSSLLKESKNFCFCGLALGKKYRDCAIEVAKDLERYHPEVTYLILTDNPQEFAKHSNILAIEHKQKSVLFPYHDRRFAIQEALTRFDVTIQIDTDIRLLKPLVAPQEFASLSGILGRTENLQQHLAKYQPQNLSCYRNVARKLDLDMTRIPYLGEFIFVVTRDNGNELDFVEYWGEIARYLELHKIHGADGPAMGLAAVKAGLNVVHSNWSSSIEHDFVNHLKFSSGKNRTQKTFFEQLKLRADYHYRLNKTRLEALSNIKFYYH